MSAGTERTNGRAWVLYNGGIAEGPQLGLDERVEVLEATVWAQAQLDIDEAHRKRDAAWLAVETNCTDDYLIWRLHEEMFKAAEAKRRAAGLTRQRERAERLGAERDHHREQEAILQERCEANADKLADAVKALNESSTVILAALDRIRELGG